MENIIVAIGFGIGIYGLYVLKDMYCNINNLAEANSIIHEIELVLMKILIMRSLHSEDTIRRFAREIVILCNNLETLSKSKLKKKDKEYYLECVKLTKDKISEFL